MSEADIENIEKLEDDTTMKRVAMEIHDMMKRYKPRRDNMIFLLSMKKAGIENGYEIIQAAAERLIEVTMAKKGHSFGISPDIIFTWLASWNDDAAPLPYVEILASLRLLVIKRMLRGDFWIKMKGENLIIISDGEEEYKLGNGWMGP